MSKDLAIGSTGSQFSAQSLCKTLGECGDMCLEARCLEMGRERELGPLGACQKHFCSHLLDDRQG